MIKIRDKIIQMKQKLIMCAIFFMMAVGPLSLNMETADAAITHKKKGESAEQGNVIKKTTAKKSSTKVKSKKTAVFEKNAKSVVSSKYSLEEIRARLLSIIQNETVKPISTFSELNVEMRKALVNIVCTAASPLSRLGSITGSGVVVGDDGIILTNAHIAQYFLFTENTDENKISCVIRKGEPAENFYEAKLIYIPPLWINNNKNEIVKTTAKGTGERDYALLKIIKSIRKNHDLESKFNFIQPTINFPKKGEQGLVGAYPADFLGGILIDQALHIVSSVINITEYLTFNSGTIDVLALSSNVVAQRGSSGGALLDSKGELSGIIVTTTTGKTTGERTLHVLTSAYIDRNMKEDLGIGLINFLKSSTTEFGGIFASTTKPILRGILEGALKNPVGVIE